MLIIEGPDFRMEQNKSTPFFDLEMIAIINKGKEKERSELKIIGYSMPFESCLQHIVSYRMAELDETFNISEYLIAYQKEVENLQNLIEITYKFIPKKLKIKVVKSGEKELSSETGDVELIDEIEE